MGLQLLFSSMALLLLWIAEAPFCDGLLIRNICLVGLGSSGLILIGGYFWHERAAKRQRAYMEYSSWIDDEELDLAYCRR